MATTDARHAEIAESLTITSVPGKPALVLGEFDLASLGYVTEEFFISGSARSYKPVGALTEDGNWQVEPAGTAPFMTRIVVVRPADARRFNGSVMVEWLNVSGGLDFAPDWISVHREIIRSGFAFVGVSAQKVGIDGGFSLDPNGIPLKKADPGRYGSLAHPGDAFAYDMFSLAGITAGGAGKSKVMGDLEVKRLLAIGDSQSAIFLTTYVNAIDPIAQVFDGYVIHARFAMPAPLDGGSIMGGPTNMPQVARLRNDLRVPVMTVVAETDVIGNQLGDYYHARQPDNDRLRVWEIAGASHANNYLMTVGLIDSGSAPIEKIAAAYAPTKNLLLMSVDKFMNYDPQQHYVLESALWHLNRWVEKGDAPPEAPRLETRPGNPPDLVLDQNGNAKGGIRSPWVDVPIARMSGVGNEGGIIASLVGVTEPYDQASLKKLYPRGKSEYLEKFKQSLTSAIAAGFVLRADEREIEALAAAMYPA